jgi:superfamily II DNA/RNA helicase
MEKQFNLLASNRRLLLPGSVGIILQKFPIFQLTGCLLCILDEADRLIEMGLASASRNFRVV